MCHIVSCDGSQFNQKHRPNSCWHRLRLSKACEEKKVHAWNGNAYGCFKSSYTVVHQLSLCILSIYILNSYVKDFCLRFARLGIETTAFGRLSIFTKTITDVFLLDPSLSTLAFKRIQYVALIAIHQYHANIFILFWRYRDSTFSFSLFPRNISFFALYVVLCSSFLTMCPADLSLCR